MYSSIASMVANMLHSINSRESLQMLGKERGSESARDIETRRRTWGRKFMASFSDAINIGPTISAVMPSLLANLGAHVELCYVRLCRASDLETLFLSEAIMKNSM